MGGGEGVGRERVALRTSSSKNDRHPRALGNREGAERGDGGEDRDGLDEEQADHPGEHRGPFGDAEARVERGACRGGRRGGGKGEGVEVEDGDGGGGEQDFERL